MSGERELVEINRRQNNGIEVILQWVRGTIDTVVEVNDFVKPERFTVDVPEGVKPNDVFMHPYAYREQHNG